jgi:hypothetical protein
LLLCLWMAVLLWMMLVWHAPLVPAPPWVKTVCLAATVFVIVETIALPLISRRGRSIGLPTLAYAKFPFHPGETFQGVISMPRLGDLSPLTVSLRFRRGHGQRVRPLGSATVSPEALQRGGWRIPIAFAIPSESPTCSLSAPNPSWWEVTVDGSIPQVKVHATFLVPIYPRPSD